MLSAEGGPSEQEPGGYFQVEQLSPASALNELITIEGGRWGNVGKQNLSVPEKPAWGSKPYK